MFMISRKASVAKLKWRKFKPHNRLKTQAKPHSLQKPSIKTRSQQARIIIALIALVSFVLLNAALAQEMNSSARKQAGESEEVELAPNNRTHRRPRVYRLRASQFNGKLAMPPQVQPSDAEVVARQRAEPEFGLRSGKVAPKPAVNCNTSELNNVAASSQTLRLHSLAKNQLAAKATGRRQQTEAEEARRANLQQSLLANFSAASSLLESLHSDDVSVAAQSQTNSILSLVDEYDSKITTNRTKAQLSCDSGEMILRLNFSEPFKGIVYPDHDRLSPCRFFGDGHLNYELRLPLRGCGTRQAAPRFFVNDVIVRFHKTLELEEDEVKTLICRYPPPLAPLPVPASAGAADPSLDNNRRPVNGEDPFELVDSETGKAKQANSSSSPPGIETLSENLVVAPAGGGYASLDTKANLSRDVITADQFNSRILQKNANPLGAELSGSSFFERLSSIELLFLISSLMFLILLVLGLAVSYYCFRRQLAHTNRRRRAANDRASVILKRSQQAYPAPTLHYHSRPLAAASSPESDLSNPNYAMYSNRAYVPDKPAHYMLPGSSFGRGTQLQRDRSYGAGGPVVGRRDTIYRNASRHFQGHNSLLRPSYSQNPVGLSSSSLQQVSYKEPLLTLSPDNLNSHYQYSFVNKPTGRKQLYRAQNVYVNPSSLSRAKSLSSMENRAAERREFESSESDKEEPSAHESRSKLLLKSIEDSYITNYTEIHEQEYLKRDATRPLSIAEWRASQPGSFPAKSHRRSPESGSEEEEVDRYKSNLRSLTELDVNFAKSLLVEGEPKGEPGEEKSSSVLAEVGAPPPPREELSPDLILSPDYDHGGKIEQRLELRAPNAGDSPSSHNSVSYV